MLDPDREIDLEAAAPVEVEGDRERLRQVLDNLLANVRAMGRTARISRADTFLSWLPLYHDLGLIGGALLIGGSAVNVVAFLGQVWPVFLILGGLAMLVQNR